MRNRLLIIHLFSIPLLFSVPGCSRDYESELKDVHRLTGAGRRSDALGKAVDLLSELRNNYSEELDSDRKRRELAASLDGTVSAWISGSTLFIRSPGESGEYETSDRDIPFQADRIRISSKGNFILISRTIPKNSLPEQEQDKTKKKKVQKAEPPDCDFQVFSVYRPDLQFSGKIENCPGLPIVDDSGKWVYYVSKRGLSRIPVHLSPGNNEFRPTSRVVADISMFKAKYSKLDNRFYLFDYGDDTILIFHGAAGYYNLYYHNMETEKSVAIGDRYAKPALLPSVQAIFQNSGNRAANGAHSSQPGVFVFRGASGKYELQRLTGGPAPRSGTTFDAPALKNPVYVDSKEGFIWLDEKNLSFWTPRKNQNKKFPLEVREFVIYKEGILYQNAEYSLYLRKEPFTSIELELLDVIDSLSDGISDEPEDG